MNAKRDKAVAYYEALWSGDAAQAMADHLADDYVEHQATAGFSREGLLAHVAERRRAHPGHRMIVHHVLGEGDLVFLMAEEQLGGGVDHARADMVRFDAAGRIAEHWASQILDEKNRKNPRGTFDGARVDRSRDYAARFAEQFEALDDRAFNDHELEAFRISRVPEYIQHSPKGRDGLEGLIEVLSGAKAKGLDFSAIRHHTIADGDFVVSHRVYDSEPAGALMNHHTFDIFRLDAQGRAVEHWDVMEPFDDRAQVARMV